MVEGLNTKLSEVPGYAFSSEGASASLSASSGGYALAL